MGHILRCVSILYPQYAKIINLWRRGCLPIRMLLINQPEIEGRLLKLINVTDFEKKKKTPPPPPQLQMQNMWTNGIGKI